MTNNIYELYNQTNSQAVAAAASASTTFPPLPPFPPSNAPDPTQDPNWPLDGSDFSGTNYMQALVKALTYIDAHPSDPMGFINLMKIVARLATTSQNGSTLLSQAESKFQAWGIDPNVIGNLLADGIDYASQFGFLYGYTGQSPGDVDAPGTAAGYTGFATTLLASLPSNSSDPLIKQMIAECTNIQNNVGTFLNGDSTANPPILGHIWNHIPVPGLTDVNGNPLQIGDIIYTYNVNGTIVYYDWTAAMAEKNGTYSNPNGTPYQGSPDSILQFIVSSIEDSSGASGGPNTDITSLDQILNQLHIQDSLDTFEEVLKETGDVGMAILAFIYEWEGYNMNTGLSGPADVMDQEKKFSQMAQQIENDLKEIGTFSNPPTAAQGAIAQQIAVNTLTLFQMIQGNGQFAQGLGSAVTSAMQTFESTTLSFSIPIPNGPFTGSESMMQMMTDVVTGQLGAEGVSAGQTFAAALQQTLAPNAPSGGPSTGSGTSPYPDPGATALQGVLGGFDGLITAVSSNSSAEVTSSQQMESLITAMDKVMTGVTDKSQGISTGVIGSTIKNQISQ